MKLILIGILLSGPSLWAAEYGVFMVVKGKVKIESPSAISEAKVGSRIVEGESVVTDTDSRAKIVMSDRNIINISPNTKLKIEKYSNTSKDKNVRLNLIEGKVRNNVEQKYNNKNSKFEVRTATAVAGVRGTQFITSYSPKTGVTEVVTLRGRVNFQSMNSQTNAPVSEPVVVEKGEKSAAGSGAAASAPAKVPPQEIRQIEIETAVKKDTPAGGPAGGAAGGAAGAAPGGGSGGSETKDGDASDTNGGKKNESGTTAEPAAESGRGMIKSPGGPGMVPDLGRLRDNANTKKFEKSKVKVIIKPGS